MIQPFSTTQIKQVFSFPFADPHWQNKIIIGLAVMLAATFIPILPILVLYGYIYQIMHRVIVEDGELHLPEWGDLGKLFKDGWRFFCVSFLYHLPACLLLFAGLALYFGGLLGFMIQIENDPNTTHVFWFFLTIGLFWICLTVGSLLYGVVSFFIPPALGHTVANDSFKAGFEFSGWWPIFKANFGGFCLALMIDIGLLAVIITVNQLLYMSMILICLMYVVGIAGGFYFLLVSSGLNALVYREGVEKIKSIPDAIVSAVAQENPA
jgi:hypothetical protein